MKTFILSLLLLSSYAHIMSKDIKGRVFDSENRPIEFANVAAFVNDSIVGGCVTDSIGLFSFSAPDNCNKIRVSYIGYADAVLSPRDGSLGNIILRQTSTTLKEVVVNAPLISREADRIVLNVAANPLSANKDAQELLKTAPGVWATDNSLSIYGQGGTSVYIDDRKVNMSGAQLMSYLKSIQSSSIATIEIIPKAGAEYSADSTGGIIKINLRRNRVDGLNGSAGFNVTAGKYKQWFNPFVNFGVHSGRWTFNLNGNINGSPSDRYTSHEESSNSSSLQELYGISHHKEKAIQGNISLGVFYDATERDRFGLQLEYNPSKTRHISKSQTEMFEPELVGSTIGSYDSNEKFGNVSMSLNWSHDFDEKGSVLKLITNYNYQNTSVHEDNIMSWSYVLNDSIYNTDSRNRYNVFVTDLSFRKVFNPRWNLTAGAKYTYNNVSNKSLHHFSRDNTWIPDTKYDFDSSYDENILAIYSTANYKVRRWQFKAGIRAEYSTTKGGVRVSDRFDLFPNANISYDFTEKGDYTLALGYYRNIRRPSFNSLNPVIRQVSDYTYTIGNQHLTPSFTDALSLDFMLAGKFTVAAGISRTDNPIRQMFTSSPEHPERWYLTWGNQGKDRRMFLHGDGFLNITKWWSLYSGLTYVLTSQKFTDAGSFDTFGYVQLVASTTLTLPKRFNLTLNCFYNSRMKIGNITVYPLINLNPTLQKQLGNHWSLSLGVEDLLQRTGKLRTESSVYKRLSYTKLHATIKLGMTYKFNSGKKFGIRRIEKSTDNSRFNKD